MRSAAWVLALVPAVAMAATGGKAPDLGRKTDSGGPSVELAGDITRAKVEKAEEERPNLGYDTFRFSVELQLKGKRAELMRTLEQMVDLNEDSQEKPDLLFRLAELSWEESRYWFFEANRQDDRVARCKETKEPGCDAGAEADRKAFQDKSNQYQDAAIARYKELIQQFPDYSRVDEVLFYLGHNLWESGKEQDALGAYKALITRFPQSRFVPDAYLAYGEWYFNNSDGKRDMLQKALEAYVKASSFTESKVYGFAIYKQGWCHYNLGDFPAAADKFKATVFYGELASNVAGDNKTALIREARKDYVLAYSRYGDPTQAKPAFLQVGGDENWWSMLKSLAGLYYDDGKDKEAVLVYRQLIRERPLSPEAPFFQARIVDAVMRVGNKRITVEQARLLVKIFQDVEQSGAIQTDEDRATLDSARKLSERTLSNLAVVWHNEGKKTRDEETYAFASEVYGDYFAIFPDSEKAYSLRFYHAELLYDQLHNYEFAADTYSKVVQLDVERIEKGEAPGKWMVQALEGAIFSNDEVVKKLGDEPLPEGADPKNPLPIPAPKQALLTACENYLKYVPNGKKRVEVAYRAAQIQYRYNHFEGAVARFSEIALEHPENELAEYSANLVLDVFNLLGDYEKIDEWAKRFHSEPRLAKGPFKLELERIIERNSFKLVALLEKEERYGDAGDRYLSFVSAWPRSELAGEALFNASVDYYKAGRIEDALATRDRLVRDYPQSKMTPMAIFLNASVFEEIGELDRAATGYEAYAAGYERQRPPAPARRGAKAQPPPKPGPEFEEEKAKAALFNAGIFREALGDFRRAQKNREKYLDLWPKAADAEAIFLSIADLHERAGAYPQAVRQLELYEKEYGRNPGKKLLAWYRIAKIQDARGQKWQAQKTYEKIWNTYRILPKAVQRSLSTEPGNAMEGVATAHYLLAEPLWKDFAKIKLRLPEQAMAERLKAKAAGLLEVQKRYTETVGFKIPGPALCGLTRIGLAYHEFAQTLYDAPIPRGLTEEQVDLYRSALAEQANPIEEKAQEALATAVEKSRELEQDNECSAEARGLLEQWAPHRFPPLLGEIARVVPASTQARGNGILASIQPIPPPPPKDAKVPAVVEERVPSRSPEPDVAPQRSSRPSLISGEKEAPLAPRQNQDDLDDDDLL
ncbi:tetratricopeptide repeat protein [Vulgatibacter incomptus]|uniref:TPR domain protein, putative component of TonB system n=1 Tax=Vulgatibacter incomptus TaxID=1391653 RepID=A0A0K1PCR5_9BACT|nr:tetratricopeptide repeat protein [Vulgatibacter incomptus]AKU91310.1 TPR domain protein, putative component of TonB system [Vulgatibacter incomptus]